MALGAGVHAFDGGAGVFLGADHLLARRLATLLLVIVDAFVLLREAVELTEHVIWNRKAMVMYYNITADGVM